MGFSIDDLLNMNPQPAQDNLPPIPMRNDYVPDPQVTNYITKKYQDQIKPKAPAAAPVQTQVAAVTPQTPSEWDQFKNKFSDDNLKKAQADAADQKSGLGWAQFAAGIGDAIAGRSSAQTAQNFDNIRKNIDDKTVGAFEKQKAAAMQDISTKKSLEGSDPNSEKSKVVQATISKLWGDKFTPDQISKITADDADLVYKPMELKAKLEEQHANNVMKNEMMRQNQQDRQEKNQQTAYTDMRNKAMTFRGNKAVQNANEALRNSDSAMQIINSKKDYNKLNDTEYNMLTAEVAKIATGGAATEGSIHDARASTLMSKAASWWQSVSGKPTPAQLGEFVKQNKDYLLHLNEVNHKYVDDFQMNNAKAYKGRVSPDQYNEYMQDFGPKARMMNDPNKPQTVIQNGHTYTLNPQTGEYE